MKEFEPKGTPQANEKARKKLIKSLKEDKSITDEELIFKYGNPPESEVDEVIAGLEWESPEVSQKMEKIDNFLFIYGQKMDEWKKTVEGIMSNVDEISGQEKLSTYNQILYDIKSAQSEWRSYAADSTDMHKQIYGDIIRNLNKMTFDIASLFKKNQE